MADGSPFIYPPFSCNLNAPLNIGVEGVFPPRFRLLFEIANAIYDPLGRECAGYGFQAKFFMKALEENTRRCILIPQDALSISILREANGSDRYVIPDFSCRLLVGTMPGLAPFRFPAGYHWAPVLFTVESKWFPRNWLRRWGNRIATSTTDERRKNVYALASMDLQDRASGHNDQIYDHLAFAVRNNAAGSVPHTQSRAFAVLVIGSWFTFTSVQLQQVPLQNGVADPEEFADRLTHARARLALDGLELLWEPGAFIGTTEGDALCMRFMNEIQASLPVGYIM